MSTSRSPSSCRFSSNSKWLTRNPASEEIPLRAGPSLPWWKPARPSRSPCTWKSARSSRSIPEPANTWSVYGEQSPRPSSPEERTRPTGCGAESLPRPLIGKPGVHRMGVDQHREIQELIDVLKRNNLAELEYERDGF